MREQDFRQGTASELLELIGPGKSGIPKDAASLSTQIMKPHITDALKTYGITVQRKRTPTKRLLQISNITNITE